MPIRRQTVRKPPLADRVDEVLKNGPMSFYDLAHKLYPDCDSHRHAIHGGPPGCYMTLSATLRKGGFLEAARGVGPGHRIVFARKRRQDAV